MNRRYAIDISSIHSVSIYDNKTNKIVYSRSLKSYQFDTTKIKFDDLPQYARRAFYEKMNELKERIEQNNL